MRFMIYNTIIKFNNLNVYLSVHVIGWFIQQAVTNSFVSITVAVYSYVNTTQWLMHVFFLSWKWQKCKKKAVTVLQIWNFPSKLFPLLIVSSLLNFWKEHADCLNLCCT